MISSTLRIHCFQSETKFKIVIFLLNEMNDRILKVNNNVCMEQKITCSNFAVFLTVCKFLVGKIVALLINANVDYELTRWFSIA